MTRLARFVKRAAGWAGQGQSLSARLAGEQDRWFLWLPVGMAAGSVIYFALPREPFLAALALCVLLGLLAAWRLRRGFAGLLAVMFLTAVACGALAAKLRTGAVLTPAISAQLRGAAISGWVEEIEPRRNGRWRVQMRVHSIARIAPAATPFRILVSMRNAEALSGLRAGDGIRVRATVSRPPGPVSPGGYNFAREAFFHSIGGVGFAFMPAEKWADAPPAPIDLRIAVGIETMRRYIGARITSVLAGQTGAIAAALITGIRGDIDESSLEALRTAGLAHILAISGLHMSLMAGSLFWLVRALLALSPQLALRYPIKKIAAMTALAGGTFYLTLSGAGIATQRAYVMIVVMFLAVLLDRPALTMRNVALAAIVVIVLRPESVLTPSFQMSFAAAVSLIAAYEFRLARHDPEPGAVARPGLSMRLARTAAFYVLAILVTTILVTTIVASSATAPFAAYHFNRVAPFSLAGNLLAMPLVGMLVMPMALCSLLALPFGLEPYPLALMGLGIDWVLAAAHLVASWPSADMRITRMPGLSLILIVAGGLWLVLWRTRWRILGVAPVAMAFALGAMARGPDLLIDRNARTLALRGDDGRLSVFMQARSDFAAARWLEGDGDSRKVEEAKSDAFACDDMACVGPLPQGGRIAIVKHPAALDAECASARIVITEFELLRACIGPQMVIDSRDLEYRGARAVWFNGAGLEAVAIEPEPGARPWAAPHRPERTGTQPPAGDQPAGHPSRSSPKNSI